MTDPHEPLKFKINNPLSRIRHRKPTTRGRMCSQNLSIFGGKDLYENKSMGEFPVYENDAQGLSDIFKLYGKFGFSRLMKLARGRNNLGNIN